MWRKASGRAAGRGVMGRGRGCAGSPADCLGRALIHVDELGAVHLIKVPGKGAAESGSADDALDVDDIYGGAAPRGEVAEQQVERKGFAIIDDAMRIAGGR